MVISRINVCGTESFITEGEEIAAAASVSGLSYFSQPGIIVIIHLKSSFSFFPNMKMGHVSFHNSFLGWLKTFAFFKCISLGGRMILLRPDRRDYHNLFLV